MAKEKKKKCGKVSIVPKELQKLGYGAHDPLPMLCPTHGEVTISPREYGIMRGEYCPLCFVLDKDGEILEDGKQ